VDCEDPCAVTRTILPLPYMHGPVLTISCCHEPLPIRSVQQMISTPKHAHSNHSCGIMQLCG
jgi:hypothetical protein